MYLAYTRYFTLVSFLFYRVVRRSSYLDMPHWHLLQLDQLIFHSKPEDGKNLLVPEIPKLTIERRDFPRKSFVNLTDRYINPMCPPNNSSTSSTSSRPWQVFRFHSQFSRTSRTQTKWTHYFVSSASSSAWATTRQTNKRTTPPNKCRTQRPNVTFHFPTILCRHGVQSAKVLTAAALLLARDTTPDLIIR